MSPRVTDSAGQAWLRQNVSEVKAQTDLAISEETASAVEIESWLQRRGVQYAKATGIPMNMIDTKRSRANQARRDPLVTDSVERFAQAFRQGRPFPPIVVYPQGSRLVIIDGNNRHEAATRAKREFIFGIIISEATDSETIQLLTVEANSTHGVTPPVEWRVQQAFHLCNLGHGDELAAEAAGISLTQLRNARTAREAEQRAKALGVYGFSELPLTAKQYMNAVKNEPVFFAAARLAAGARLSVDQVRDLIRAVRTGSSEAEQLAIIAEQANLLKVEAANKKLEARGIKGSPRQALVSGIGLITKCDVAALVNSVKTVHDRDTINAKLKETEEKLLELMVAMEELKGLEL